MDSDELKKEIHEIEKKMFLWLAPYIMHQCWVSYQIGCGQPYNITPTEAQMASLLDACQAFLENPDMTPEQNHEHWMKYKLANGWKYGIKKDERRKEHPDLKPFKELPLVEQNKDVMDIEARKMATIFVKTVTLVTNIAKIDIEISQRGEGVH